MAHALAEPLDDWEDWEGEDWEGAQQQRAPSRGEAASDGMQQQQQQQQPAQQPQQELPAPLPPPPPPPPPQQQQQQESDGEGEEAPDEAGLHREWGDAWGRAASGGHHLSDMEDEEEGDGAGVGE